MPYWSVAKQNKRCARHTWLLINVNFTTVGITTYNNITFRNHNVSQSMLRTIYEIK